MPEMFIKILGIDNNFIMKIDRHRFFYNHEWL